MPILLELPDDMADVLRRDAASMGLTLTDYALRLLAPGRPAEPTPPPNAALAALERIADAGGATEFPHDLVAWQREMRKDRPLPGRDE